MCITVAAMPTQSAIIVIVRPSGEDLPSLIAVNSSQATIAAGSPVNGPQHNSAAAASPTAIIGRCDG